MTNEQPKIFPSVALGSRVRCVMCGSEAVVTKLGDVPQVACHGQPLEVIGGGGTGNAS
jgi:hypothetical protein